MSTRLWQRVTTLARAAIQTLHHGIVAATKPATGPLIGGTLADAVRSKPALVAENALLRQQLILLQRRVKRPRCMPAERAVLVLLASRVRAWRQTLLIVQPETVLRWHRQLFRWYWRRRSGGAAPAHRPPLASATIALIRAMAAANRTWGAARIRGELLKLNIRVATSTIQRYMRGARPPRRSGQTWATFLRNHGHDIWACDFLPVTDLLFRPLTAFVVIAVASRRIVHVGVTRHPTDAWTAQQLREATAGGQRPTHLIHDIHDNDSTYGPAVTRVATASGIEERRTA